VQVLITDQCGPLSKSMPQRSYLLCWRGS